MKSQKVTQICQMLSGRVGICCHISQRAIDRYLNCSLAGIRVGIPINIFHTWRGVLSGIQNGGVGKGLSKLKQITKLQKLVLG